MEVGGKAQRQRCRCHIRQCDLGVGAIGKRAHWFFFQNLMVGYMGGREKGMERGEGDTIY